MLPSVGSLTNLYSLPGPTFYSFQHLLVVQSIINPAMESSIGDVGNLIIQSFPPKPQLGSCEQLLTRPKDSQFHS